MTKLYHYSPETGEYTHTTDARLDPKEGTPMVPANATTTKPPVPAEKEASVWDGSGWSKVPDHRGVEFWTADGGHHRIEELGVPLPPDALAAPPPPTAEELAARRAASVSGECRRRIYAVASAEAQMNMAAKVGVIAGKATSARTNDEKAILVGAEAAIGWVAAMRAAVATLAADADADFTADAAWPDAPLEALAMVQHF